jgi:hypothetical protein
MHVVEKAKKDLISLLAFHQRPYLLSTQDMLLAISPNLHILLPTTFFFYLTSKFFPCRCDVTIVLFICSAISSSEKCLRVSKTESYGLSRICFEMTCQATMPSSSEKCLRVSKTESYTLSRICFEMTRQATMPSSKAWLCLADEQHIWPMLPTNLSFEQTNFDGCGRKSDRWGQIFVIKKSSKLLVERPFFSQFKRCFAIIWGKKHAGAQSKSSLRSFWNWAFVLTTATVA